MSKWKTGDRVQINDHSIDAHGEIGTVYHVMDDGLVMVEFDEEENLWPVAPGDLLTAPSRASEGE